MKKIILLLYLTAFILTTGYSQNTTSYGNGAGSVGQSNSFFGTSAGANQNAPYSNYNTAIGAFSMADHSAAEYNTAIGAGSLHYGGIGCTATGYNALWNNSYHPYPADPTNRAYYNTAIGFKSMNQNQIGDYNTGVGAETLYWNHSNFNSAFGYHALHENNEGQYNTASGALSLYSNISGDLNTANGYHSLYSNTTGYQNTAVGYRTLHSNSTGYRNTAIGTYALNANINGNFNTATGYYAAYSNNIGTHNTANGFRALDSNTTGNYNTAHGAFALDFITGGSYNSAVGYNAGPTNDLLSNTTAIGYNAVPTASNQVRIGNTSVTSIGGQVAWTVFSDGRFKKDIREDVSGLDFINQLRPVSYTVDKIGLNKFLHINDSSSSIAEAKSVPARHTGFVAQEVEAVVKKSGYIFYGVDAPENENDPYGIRYAEFVGPLVKAVQELSAQVQMLLAERESTREDTRSYTGVALFQNNPNPFDVDTEIKMILPDNVGYATMIIYNLEGKQLKTIQVSDRGDVQVKISANELSAGMYLYSLITDGKVVDTKRMVLTR